MNQTAVKIITLLNFLFLFNAVFAKYNYKPGYIVTLTNDTVHGLVDYGSAAHNSAHCTFRKDSLSPATDYLPAELNGYGFSFNRHFVTKKIRLDSTSIVRSFFMEHLVNGSVDLYFLDDLGLTYFFIEQKNELYVLKNEEVKFIENGTAYTRRSNSYKRTLKYLLQDVPSILPDIDRTAFNRKSLIALIENYHKAGKSPYVTYHDLKIKAPHEKWKFHFGVNAGYTYSKMGLVSSVSKIEKYVFPGDPYKNITADATILETNMWGIDQQGGKNTFSKNNKVFPGLSLNFRAGKNTVGIELNYLRNNYQLKDIVVQTDKIRIPLTYQRAFGYRKKVMPFLNIGVCMDYNFKVSVDNLYINYSAPDQNGYNYQFVMHSEFISKENSSYKNGAWGGGVIIGTGIFHDLLNKTRLELGLTMSLTNNYFSSVFDSHIYTRTALSERNISLTAKILF